MSTYRFCIDVECLFDFRLGVIAGHSAKAYHDCFLSDIKRYIHRDNDRFFDWCDAFTEEEYLDKYRARDKATFKNAIMTNVFNMLHEIKHEMTSGNDLKEDDSLELTINIQHYLLSDEEKEALSVLFQSQFGYDYKVDIISIPLKELSPEVIKSKFDVVFLYDFEAWSECFIDPDKKDSLFHHPMGDVLMYVPYKLIPSEDVVLDTLKSVTDSFEIDPQFKAQYQDPKLILSSALLGYVHLIFCDLKYYSVTTSILKE